jgi:hypothetical protein
VMSTTGRATERQNPTRPSGLEPAWMIWEPIRVSHQGQRPSRAAHKGRTHDRTRNQVVTSLQFFLAMQEPSTHDRAKATPCPVMTMGRIGVAPPRNDVMGTP